MDNRLVVLSLGTNLGDRELNMASMENLIRELLDSEIRLSPLFETEPVGVDAHQNYLNRIISGNFSGSPMDLLRATQAIENEMGRTNKGELAPRTADIDILLYGNETITTDELTIPHHALFDRHFEILGAKLVVPTMKIPNSDITFEEYIIDPEVKSQHVHIVNQTEKSK